LGQLQAKLVGIGAKSNALQGYSVSLSDDGDYVMLGGRSDNRDSESVRAARVGLRHICQDSWSGDLRRSERIQSMVFHYRDQRA